MFVDVFVMLKGVKNWIVVYKFFDYILCFEVSKLIFEEFFYMNLNGEVWKLLMKDEF